MSIKLVLCIAAAVVAMLVVGAIYEAGGSKEQADAIKRNDAARGGADDFDLGVSGCAPGNFDFGSGRCLK